jgi:hypothetical protein
MAAVLLNACTDLEMKSDGRDTLNSIFSNYGKTKNYFNNCLSGIIQPDGNYGYSGAFLAAFSDEAQDVSDATSTSVAANWYAGQTSSLNNLLASNNYSWAAYYQTIRRCNTFLQSIEDPELATYVFNETERQGWIAQVRVVRAYTYLQIVKRWGPCPIVDVPYEADYDYSQSNRASVGDVTDYIIGQCDEALRSPESESNVSFRWKLVGDTERGMITRGFAHAVRSEAALLAASPLWGEYSWEKAAKITKDALDQCLAHDFKLYDTPVNEATAQNPYAYYFIQRSDPARLLDKETIYESTTQLTVWKTSGTPVWEGTTSAGACPTQELIDAYETTNGEPVLNLSNPYTGGDHTKPNYNANNTLYNPNDPYANRDPRFYASIYYNGAPRTLTSSEPTPGSTVPINYDLNGNEYGCTFTENGDGSLTMSDFYDPESGGWFYTASPGEAVKGDLYRFVFEYKSNKSIDNFIYFSDGGCLSVPAADDWTEISIGVIAGESGLAPEWRTYRFWFDNPDDISGYEISIRNMRLVGEFRPVSDTKYVETFTGGNSEMRSDDKRFTRTGYYLRKFNNHRSNVNVASDGYIKVYRLAELYLNFAEAAYNAQGPDAAISGMTAREAVNAVRTRAGMPGLPTGMGKEEFERRYRNERRVELAFEEKRFFDVRRWKILEETDKAVTGMKITRTGNESDGYAYQYERVPVATRQCADSRYLLFPIDQSEVNKMNALTGTDWQNPGW